MPDRLGRYAFLLVLVMAILPAHSQAIYQFDLPEQPLADSLRAILGSARLVRLFMGYYLELAHWERGRHGNQPQSLPARRDPRRPVDAHYG